MFTRIVVGTDGSPRAEQAVDTALELGRTHGAEVHVVCAHQAAVSAALAGAMGAGVAIAPTGAEDTRGPAWEIASAVAARSAGVTVIPRAVPGAAPEALVETARTVGADLIVVGNRGMTGRSRLLGSVPNTVTHTAPCSVLVVQTT